MLPVEHFHVVFTLPDTLRALARAAPAVTYDLLMKAAAETLQQLARETLGAQLAITEVLHTWTRALLLHPHVHCIVSAGGLSLDGRRWVERCRYLFAHKVLGRVFRGIVLRRLIEERDKGALPEAATGRAVRLLTRGARKQWVVFVDAPRGRDPQALLRYLGRYIQRIAISDRRVVRITDRDVVFRTKGGEVCTLPIDDFIGRFLLHVLPKGFRKVRHYGLLAPGCEERRAAAVALLGGVPAAADDSADIDDEGDAGDAGDVDAGEEPWAPGCPHCGGRTLVWVAALPRAGRQSSELMWSDTS